MSDLRQGPHVVGLPPILPPHMPPSGVGGVKKPQAKRSKKDYSPVCWDKYFSTEQDVKVSNYDTFRVYQRGNSGPVLLLLHGGGHSALSWAVFSSVMTELVTCQCVAVDLRGHGDSQTENDEDLSAETLSSDVGNVVQTLFGTDPPPIILIGHSMGGSVAIHTAHRQLLPSLIGLAVIDVVEGTAMEALSSMQSFLKSRPSSFESLEEVIEWALRAGQIRNLESAKVSMIGQVKRVDNSETATSELEHKHESAFTVTAGSTDTIVEEEEQEETAPTNTPETPASQDNPVSAEKESIQEDTPKSTSHRYTWRIDLSKTAMYWPGWFSGMSNIFLSCGVPKMLILAGIDRLDKDLTIGQMQGKFQMQVLPQCGHAVHEDVPKKVADVLANFLVRHRFVEPKEHFNRIFPAC